MVSRARLGALAYVTTSEAWCLNIWRKNRDQPGAHLPSVIVTAPTIAPLLVLAEWAAVVKFFGRYS